MSNFKQSFRRDEGQIDFENFNETLERFETDQIDYLFDVEPQSQNLFWVGHFTQGGDLKTFYNSQFRIRNIKLPDLTFEMKNNELTKLAQFQSASYERKITISWFEDVYHSVQKYHEDWMDRWWNKTYDTLRCGVNGKFRKMDLVAYHRKNTGNENSIIETPEIEPLFVYEITGMVPINIPGMMFDFEKDGNDELFTATYICSKIDLRFSNKLGLGTNKNIYDNGDTSARELNNNSQSRNIWTPTGIIETEVGDDENKGREGLRIARSSSTHYDSLIV